MARALVRDQPHALVRDQPRAPVRSPSRAAAFALRAALVAPAALGCGGEEGSLERDGAQEVAAAGSDGSTGTAGGGGAGAFIDLVGGENAAAGAGGALADGAAADAGAGDAGFVPVPIYGGVFPDPVTRARV